MAKWLELSLLVKCTWLGEDDWVSCQYCKQRNQFDTGNHNWNRQSQLMHIYIYILYYTGWVQHYFWYAFWNDVLSFSCHKMILTSIQLDFVSSYNTPDNGVLCFCSLLVLHFIQQQWTPATGDEMRWGKSSFKVFLHHMIMMDLCYLLTVSQQNIIQFYKDHRMQ